MASLVRTIGHSTHSLEAFEGLLAAHGIGAVADVRRFPGSRRMPHFGAEALAGSLGRAGVEYIHLPGLGGRRTRDAGSDVNAGWGNAAFRGYADHMASPEFAAGLARLEALARERPTAVMCAEGAWWRCHRRLIADALLARGWEVVHILPDGRTSPHELTSFAVVAGERITYPPARGRLE